MCILRNGIKFTLNNMEYRIVFRYSRDGLSFPMIADCYIYDASGRPHLHGRAMCKYPDQPVRETGRRLALTHALKDWGRPERTAAWKAYHGRKHGPI